MVKRNLGAVVICFLTTGCTITQEVEPTQISKDNELCIVENPDVREGFLEELRAVLNVRSVAHRVVSEPEAPDECEWTMTYVAKWSWDLALYMSYAELNVFRNGQLDGQAKYDATRGSGNPGKFIDAETKIRELVDELFQLESGSLFRLKFG